ncbi:MAG: hypothetical protein M3R63_00400 [Actinomycetota bacterium]|nr:hypothetical protein [Actinomycetota bacterium]
MDRAALERRIVAAASASRHWEVASPDGKGPVTISVEMPELTITDSEGRHIVLSPEQSELVSARIGDITCWMAEVTDTWGAQE